MNSPFQPAAPARKPLTLWLLLAITLLAVAAPFFLASRGKEIVTWRSDVDAALAEAKAAGKSVLIDFTADWCPPCKLMKREVFSKERVKAAIEAGFVAVRVDCSRPDGPGKATSERHEIKYLPTYVVLTPGGTELRRFSGAMDEETFLAWLRETPAAAEPAK